MSATIASTPCTKKLTELEPAGIVTTIESVPSVVAFGANCTTPSRSAVIFTGMPPAGAGALTETERARWSPEPM